jgi:Protein of unknown function (DUF3102)
MTADSNSAPVLADLAERINQAHEGAIRSLCTTFEYASSCGELLIEAKALVPHGGWASWLKENTVVSERTAQRTAPHPMSAFHQERRLYCSPSKHRFQSLFKVILLPPHGVL